MFKSILASTAAAGLLLAPIAAQANTRALDSGVSLAPIADAVRSGSPVGAAERQFGEMPEWLLVLLFGIVAVTTIVVIENSEDDASPGTGN